MHYTPIDTNKAYHLKVVARGSTITVHLDGSQVIAVTDTSFTRGGCGLNVWNSVSLFNRISYTPLTQGGAA
jgi:hypothetical protein